MISAVVNPPMVWLEIICERSVSWYIPKPSERFLRGRVCSFDLPLTCTHAPASLCSYDNSRRPYRHQYLDPTDGVGVVAVAKAPNGAREYFTGGHSSNDPADCGHRCRILPSISKRKKREHTLRYLFSPRVFHA